MEEGWEEEKRGARGNGSDEVARFSDKADLKLSLKCGTMGPAWAMLSSQGGNLCSACASCACSSSWPSLWREAGRRSPAASSAVPTGSTANPRGQAGYPVADPDRRQRGGRGLGYVHRRGRGRPAARQLLPVRPLCGRHRVQELSMAWFDGTIWNATVVDDAWYMAPPTPWPWTPRAGRTSPMPKYDCYGGCGSLELRYALYDGISWQSRWWRAAA